MADTAIKNANSSSAKQKEVSFCPFEFSPPQQWPSRFGWLPTARANALDLFPAQVYQKERVDHQLLGKKVITISHPETFRSICGRDSKRYRLSNMHLRILTPALGEGLIVAQGEKWGKQRKLANDLVKRALSRDLAETADIRINHLVDEWRLHAKSGGNFDPISSLVKASMDLIAIEIFNYSNSVGSENVLRLIAQHREAAENVDWLDAMGLPPWVVSSKMRRSRTAASSMDHEIDHVIANAITERTKSGMKTTPVDRDFVVSMLSGFESVAMSCCWLLYLLASNEKLASTLNHETHSGDNDPPFKLNSAIMETVRLFPPLPIIFRECTNKHVTAVGDINRGDLVCLSPWIIHRHNAHWNNPNYFDLNRFMSPQSHTAFFPFGSGVRKCVGQDLGFRLITSIIKKLNSKFKFDLTNCFPAPRAGISLRPLGNSDLHITER